MVPKGVATLDFLARSVPNTPMRTSLTALLLALLLAPISFAQEWMVLPSPDNSLDLKLIADKMPALHLTTAGWGPKWGWVGVSSKTKGKDGTLDINFPFKTTNGTINLHQQVSQFSPNQITLQYNLSADADVPLTMLIASLGIEKSAGGGKLVLTHADNSQSTLKFPLGLGNKPAATKADIALDSGASISIAFDPPALIAHDGDLRIVLAADTYKKGKSTQLILINFPKPVSFLANPKDLDQFTTELATPAWFDFKPSDDLTPCPISMEEWLEKPAGKRGGVRMVGDHFELADGSPIKFWGSNLSYGHACAPAKDIATFTAKRFAHFGISGIRLHKFTYPKNQMGIGDNNDPTIMSPDGYDRLDFFANELKNNGVYFGWSHTYGYHVGPGNRDKLLAYDEIEKNLKGNTYGFINFAEDVQSLLIETCVNLLKHKNVYTGLTYAQEPALSFIELQNEDDIFFYTSEKAFGTCPTYKKAFTVRFCDWLTAKYGDEAALKKAWGDALKPNESLAAKTIVPVSNPWFFSDGKLPNTTGGERQRLLDTAAHFHELQNKFYARYVKAIRDAGYAGPICGSPWQAPSMLPHYLNLKSDYLAGYIDRHNYFGGKLTDSMLTKPGSGYFSSGLQQVIDRPFGLSEWIHVYPSLYSAEGPVIVAAYGMGLQGWDASYQFQSQPLKHMYQDRAGWPPFGVWEADTPTQLGQYPLLSRMVLRGDVKESAPISIRRISPEDLATGKFNFSDKVEQQGDIKSFTGTVPPEALAAGRVAVEFVDKPSPSTLPDMASFKNGTAIISATKQLNWDPADKGRITIDTPATKGLIGFAQDKPAKLGDITLTSQSPYASILLTASEKSADLATCKSALLSVVARSINSGFKIVCVDGRILENGKGPILLEPVKAQVALTRAVEKVEVLDQDGRPTGRTLAAQGPVQIDTGRDQTMYYRVVFK